MKEGEVPRPWSPEALFGRVAPVEFEIGSGKGMFIRKAAAANPDHDFLGVEVSYRYALTSAAGLAKNGIPNAKMICADAAKLLEEWIPDGALVAVHVYFPDPWWKKSHRKRRIMRDDVIRLIERRLVPGGKLHFWTDVEEYFYSGLEAVRRSSGLLGPFPVEDPTENIVASDDRISEKPGKESDKVTGEVGNNREEGSEEEREGDRFRTSDSPTVPYYGEQGNQNPPVLTDTGGDFLSHFERRTRLNHLPVWRSYFVKPETTPNETESRGN